MHDEETTGDLPLGVGPLAVCHGRLTDVSMKQRAEGAETLKSDFEAHVRHAQFVAAEQFFRFLDATLDQVLMRCLVECFPEQPEEVITRKAGFLRNLIEAERMIVAVVDKTARAIKPLKRFEVCRLSVVDSFDHYGFGGNGFCNDDLMNSSKPASLPLCRNL